MNEPKLKLCGNQSLQDIQLSVHSGAHFIGIIFAESKRKVHPVHCGGWLRQINKRNEQKYVGVFVNPTLQEILHVLQHVPLDIIQFHGNESRDEIEKAKNLTQLLVWKAIHHDDDGLNQMKNYHGVVDGYVIDSKVKGAWGGTGERFDWEAIPTYTKEAETQDVPCLIAGGITHENVEQILTYSPHGIDISSGIETNGKKDNYKIEMVVKKLKQN